MGRRRRRGLQGGGEGKGREVPGKWKRTGLESEDEVTRRKIGRSGKTKRQRLKRSEERRLNYNKGGNILRKGKRDSLEGANWKKLERDEERKEGKGRGLDNHNWKKR